MLAESDSSSTGLRKSGTGLTSPVSSNNPFLLSPSKKTVQTSQTSFRVDTVPRHPTNPFLAAFEQELSPTIALAVGSTDMGQQYKSDPTPSAAEDAKELFKRLAITESGCQCGKTPRGDASPIRHGGPLKDHEGSREPRSRPSSELQFRRGPNGLMIPVRSNTSNRGDVIRRSASKESRISKTSGTRDHGPGKNGTETQEKRRSDDEIKHREREGIRDSRTTETHGHSSRRRRNNQHVDVVDKLDVTGGLYGVSGMWHHDGPFDACRPVRNRKKDVLAPMGAFPTNSANQTVGGSGPINDGSVLQNFHGLEAEGFEDYSGAKCETKHFAAISAVVNPSSRVEPVHGEETMGLGTSTFLEGAPASRQAIQRTRSENTSDVGSEGLFRKKSIAMRLRGMSQTKARYQEPPTSLKRAETDYGRNNIRAQGLTLSDGSYRSPLSSPSMAGNTAFRGLEINPFDYGRHDDAYDKRGTLINVAVTEVEGEDSLASASTASAVQHTNFEHSPTENGLSSPEANHVPGSFLNRVRSLKGSGKMKTERNPS